MKKAALIATLVLALIALGIWTYHVQTRAAPGISVVLLDDTGGGGGPGIPEVDGYVNGDSGSNGNYNHSATYKVVANSKGKFFVLAHYEVERAGASTEFDLALPVFQQIPDKSNWTQLNQHLKAYAYLDGSTILY